MNRGRKLLGFIILAAAVILAWCWNNWGKAAFFSDKVPVVTQDVYRGDILTEEMIDYEYAKLNADYISSGQIEKYIGKELVQFVNEGTPFFKEYFAEEGTAPDIRKDRVYISLSGDDASNSTITLKRGDRALLCYSKSVVLETTVVSSDDKSGDFAVMTDREGALKISEMIASGRKFLIVRG